MIKSYKYKLKPTIKQQTQLNQFFGCARFVYNWGLNQKVEQYKQNKQTIGYVELAHHLTLLKKQEDTKWLNDCANVCLQQSLRNLDSAFVRFFREKKGFPKFKSKKNPKDSIKFNSSVKFIPKIKLINIVKQNKTIHIPYHFNKCNPIFFTLFLTKNIVSQIYKNTKHLCRH